MAIYPQRTSCTSDVRDPSFPSGHCIASSQHIVSLFRSWKCVNQPRERIVNYNTLAMTRGSSFDDPANTSYSASYHSHLSSADSTAQLNINTNNTTSSQSHSDHTPGQQQRTPSARLVSSLGYDASTQSPEQNRQFFRDGGELTPPSLPFAYSQSARPPSLNSDTRSAKTTSLSINYVPTKFAKLHETGVWQHRDRKQGGGREAFADNAGRMGEGEETTFQVGKGRKKAKLRWNRFKWALFVTNSAVS